MHQDQVDVVGLELLERLVDNLGDVLVLHVVDLGGQEDLLSGNTRVDDTVTDLGLVSVSLGAEDVGSKTCRRKDGKGAARASRAMA